MSWKDWLLGGCVLAVLAAVVVTVVLVMVHERSTPAAHSSRNQGVNLHYCYQNLGNGGC